MDKGESGEAEGNDTEAEGGDWAPPCLHWNPQGSCLRMHSHMAQNLVDACNGFNKLIRLAILCMVRHRWPERARFAFKCYRH